MADDERIPPEPVDDDAPAPEDDDEGQVPTQAEPSDCDVLEKGPYVDGFSLRTVLGALFVAVVMMPGSIYLGLVAGQTLGPAAEWVTIILFAEVARRSFTHLKRTGSSRPPTRPASRTAT